MIHLSIYHLKEGEIMKKTNRFIAIVLTLVMCLALLAACQPADPGGNVTPTPGPATTGPSPTPGPPTPPAPPPAGANLAPFVDVIIRTGVAILDPFIPAGSNAPTFQHINMFQDRLLNNRGDGTVEPQLATRWETDDYQTFIFYLREDVYFHNGDHFTAADVVWTVTEAQEAAGIVRTVWGSVEEVEALDTYTVRMTLESVNVDFPMVITHPAGGFYNERAMTNNRDTGIHVGTGPFKVVGFVSGDHTEFERNYDYWGELPPTERVIIRFVPEGSARTIMLMNRESHVTDAIITEDLPMFRDHSDYTVEQLVVNNPWFMAFNMAHPIAGDRNFRMAVAHALYRPDIALYAVGAEGGPELSGTFWGNTMEFRANDIPLIPRDLDLARNYLAASVWNGETIEIVASLPTQVRAMEIVQLQMAEIGIPVEVRQMDNAGLNALMAHSPTQPAGHTIVLHTSSVASLASDIRVNIHSTAVNNRAGYMNPEIDRLLDLAITQGNPAEREATYRQIQYILAEDIPFLNLYAEYRSIVAIKGVSGATFGDIVNWSWRGVYWNLDA